MFIVSLCSNVFITNKIFKIIFVEKVLTEELAQLIKIKPEKLVEMRIEKFGKMGAFTE